MSTPNANTLWSRLFVAELARCGLDAVCIAPGSRSTPLTLAFDAHPAIRVYRHLDERSAAFFALGLALAADAPVALVCTSGTATANFYPAIIEANESAVPLLVLTADRPPELRGSGANQTIDQIKLYGDHVLWSVDVGLPDTEPPVVLRHLRTLAARAYATANGLLKGPVHLNFPFRKPLEPDTPGALLPAAEEAAQRPFTLFQRGVLTPGDDQVAELATIINRHERGLILCGPRCPTGDFPAAVSELSRRTGYPILADPLSGLRFGPHIGDGAAVIGGYDTFLAGTGPDWPAPGVILRFGAVPTSKSLNDYLARITPRHRIHVRENGRWADDSHRIDSFLQADAAVVSRRLAAIVQPRTASAWQTAVLETEAATWTALDAALEGSFFDGTAVADLVAALPDECLLFAGNSLPIRHLDQFARPDARQIQILANRGASGIDGNVSTALGAAAATGLPLVMLLGDITFYHDLNGLLAIKEAGLAPTIVLLNNDGGGIFHRLPVARLEPPFTRLFLTPHGLDFAPAAALYDLDFARADDRPSLQRLLAERIGGERPSIIELRTDGRRDYERRKVIMDAVKRET